MNEASIKRARRIIDRIAPYLLIVAARLAETTNLRGLSEDDLFSIGMEGAATCLVEMPSIVGRSVGDSVLAWIGFHVGWTAIVEAVDERLEPPERVLQ